MGFAAYNFTRSTGGTHTVLFPDIEYPINLGIKNYTFLELVNFHDFPVEAHIFVYGDFEASKVSSFGFRNIIIATDYLGETWRLDNGAYIYFEDLTNDTIKHVVLRYYDKDGVELYAAQAINEAYRTDDESIYHYVSVVWGYTIYHISPYLDNKKGIYANTSPQVNLYYNYPGDAEFRAHEDNFPQVDRPDLQLFEKFFGGEKPLENFDPYRNGGETETGGGTGNFDGTGENIFLPDLPVVSATDAGFITIFNPSVSELQSLSSYMWSDVFGVDGWKKIFADPMNAILGLSIVPVSIPSSGLREVKVGNISTGITMTVAESQYVTVDCGTLNINEFWGAYLDYDPYTKFEIYLPYIGTHALSADDIMRKSVHVVYHVDILSGACCANIVCGGTVLYSFVGQCASSIPITGDSWTNVVNGALSIAGSIGLMIGTGGATAPMAVTNLAATAVNNFKPSIEKSGSLGGTGGLLGVQKPYLIITRPRQAVPKNQNSYIGYPSYITELLGDLSGYTEIESIHLENVPATDTELTEIENLLKGGVIF